MEWITYFIVAVFGLIIGSFLNVVIYRFNTNKTLGGRSACLSCSHKLAWYELVPLFSFLFQRGHCRHCRSRISWQYPTVELATSISYVAVFYKFRSVLLDPAISILSFTAIIYYWIIASILIVIFVYDIRHKIIPDFLVYLFAALAFLSPLVLGTPEILNTSGILFSTAILTSALWPALAMNTLGGIILALPFAALWFFSRGRLIGLGDAKLALGIGFLFGLASGTAVLMIAFWLGALISIILVLAKGKKYTMKSEIPFAPFIIISMAIVFFANISLFSLLSMFAWFTIS